VAAVPKFGNVEMLPSGKTRIRSKIRPPLLDCAKRVF
jgi:hypothetical protein